MDQETLSILVDIFFAISIVICVFVGALSIKLVMNTNKTQTQKRKNKKRESMSTKEALEEQLQRLETLILLKDLEVETLQKTATILQRKRDLLLSVEHPCETEEFIQVLYQSPFALTSDFYCMECGEYVSSVKLSSRPLTEDERAEFKTKENKSLH